MPLDVKTLSVGLIIIITLSCQFLNNFNHTQVNHTVNVELTGTLS